MRAWSFERADDSVLEIRITDRTDGDFHIDADAGALSRRRAAVMAGSWAVVRQVHGNRVVPARPDAAPEADAIITATLGQPIAVQGADCAPVAFITSVGPIGVAHVGWRGLLAGVVEATAERLRREGAVVTGLLVGPTIGPECYEFGPADLDRVAARYGDGVRARTAADRPALDLAAAVVSAAGDAGIDDVVRAGPCTGCDDGYFSHRRRGEDARHALVARIAGPSDDA